MATADYSRAVQLLAERTGSVSKGEYARIRGDSEKARKKAEAACRMMDLHVAEHGC